MTLASLNPHSRTLFREPLRRAIQHTVKHTENQSELIPLEALEFIHINNKQQDLLKRHGDKKILIRH